MPVTFGKTIARIDGHAAIEEVEALQDWLGQGPRRSLNLAGAVHIHTAILQILLAGEAAIKAWPADPALNAVLRAILAKDAPKLLSPGQTP